DWADDARGRGLVIENPNAPPKVASISVSDTAAKVAAGELMVVDVRPADERGMASIKLPFKTLDDAGQAELEALPKDTALAFLCHTGARSGQVAEQFRNLGFTRLSNVEGGIAAWSEQVDPGVPTY